MATGLLSTIQPATTVPNLNQAAVIPGASVAAPATTPPPAQVVVTPTPANVASVAAPAATTPRTITNPETVAGQLNSLLASKSPYLESARNRGMETANSRGLINSSLAAGTAERSAIDAALPIAQQDATTNATAGQSAQNASQDKSLSGYNSLLASAQNRENFGYTTAENEQNIKANTDLQAARLQSTADLQAQQLQAAANLQTTLKGMDISLDLTKLDAASRDALTTATSPIVQQVQAEISQIQRTPDSTMNAAAKAQAIAEQNALLRTNIQTISTLYGYTISWPSDGATSATTYGGAPPAPPPTSQEAFNQQMANWQAAQAESVGNGGGQ